MDISYFDFLDRVSVTVVFGCRAAVEALTDRSEIALRLTVVLPLLARLLIPFRLPFVWWGSRANNQNNCVVLLRHGDINSPIQRYPLDS